jgi:hypothetical protein
VEDRDLARFAVLSSCGTAVTAFDTAKILSLVHLAP